MPSCVISYVPGSGFSPIFVSGLPFGLPSPVGGIQFRVNPSNSGYIYFSMSGANVFSGQPGLLVGSGGPTINSGTWSNLSGGGLSGRGLMDGFPLAPGDTFFLPRIAVQTGGASSGAVQFCAGCDPSASGGFARIHWEAY